MKATQFIIELRILTIEVYKPKKIGAFVCFYLILFKIQWDCITKTKQTMIDSQMRFDFFSHI